MIIQQKNKNKVGRPKENLKTRLNKLKLTIESIALMYKHGMTDEQVAQIIGIKVDGLHRWKVLDEFRLPLKHWKLEADEKVERSLYESATGYRTTAKKAFLVRDGLKSRVEIVEEDVVFQPHPTSMIFWLKNRQPDKWQDHTLPQGGDNFIITILNSFNSPDKIQEATGLLENKMRGSVASLSG